MSWGCCLDVGPGEEGGVERDFQVSGLDHCADCWPGATEGRWMTIRFGLVGEKVNSLNSVLLLLSLPPSQALSEICPFSISEDRFPAVALQGGESERRQDGSLPWLEKPHIFPTENSGSGYVLATV